MSQEPKIRVLRQHDMLKCPYVIMMPEHYRSDGSCRCDDPAHSLMKEWGYTWDEQAGRWQSIDDGSE